MNTEYYLRFASAIFHFCQFGLLNTMAKCVRRSGSGVRSNVPLTSSCKSVAELMDGQQAHGTTYRHSPSHNHVHIHILDCSLYAHTSYAFIHPIYMHMHHYLNTLYTNHLEAAFFEACHDDPRWIQCQSLSGSALSRNFARGARLPNASNTDLDGLARLSAKLNPQVATSCHDLHTGK